MKEELLELSMEEIEERITPQAQAEMAGAGGCHLSGGCHLAGGCHMSGGCHA